jgi:hypothetical protein
MRGKPVSTFSIKFAQRYRPEGANVEPRTNVRMPKSRSHFGLAFETLPQIGVSAASAEAWASSS